MYLPPRSCLIAAVLIAFGGFAATVDGCASKPPPQESVVAATATPKSQTAGTGTSADPATSAPRPSQSTPADPRASAGDRASTGDGTSAGASASAGTDTT